MLTAVMPAEPMPLPHFLLTPLKCVCAVSAHLYILLQNGLTANT